MWTFSAKKLNQLHIEAEDLWRVPAKDGWQKSPVSPMDILKLFKGIWIKEGYTLRAYIFRQGLNGNGVVWALPESEFPDVDECEWLDTLKTPKPKNTLPVMEVLEGDCSPESYISSSLFVREMREFGALWHGLSWGLHEIVDENSIDVDDYEWLVDVEDLKPKVIFGETVKVEFFTLVGVVRWRIFRHLDLYSGYRFKTETEIVAVGGEGFIP
ncbi:hypothetical protein Asulf_01611 [Archaeoglobus sulfaticallidus PM70-1]|uniref:Uncharacterized protein n=2 Tax=Archaeoglobus TaxID=2233 RepID=N0BH29_9EURY|nr:hypothetical protein Asulf_01611 [Archaeoglobus sulfaticallidus PM70-1]